MNVGRLVKLIVTLAVAATPLVSCAAEDSGTTRAPASLPTQAPTATAATVTATATVYYFFSTTCEYCAAQAPDMEQFHRQNPSAQVVGVPLSASESEARSFAQRYGLTFEVRQDGPLVKALGPVSKHPVIAFQRTAGGPLSIASNGRISVASLKESYDTFARGGQPAQKTGYG